MNIFDWVRLLWRTLCAVALLATGGLLVLLALSLALNGEFGPALAAGVLATVPLGPGLVMVGEATQLRREARDPLAAVQPVKQRHPGVWSFLGRLQMAVLFLSFGFMATRTGFGGLVAHPGVVQVLFALVVLLLGVTGLGIGLSVLVNRGYWLWDNGGYRGGTMSEWRGSKRRW